MIPYTMHYALYTIQPTLYTIHHVPCTKHQVMQGFKTGNVQVLVATDVAARGLDVKDIEV
ncbi:hypothetical protein EON63_15495 [archaeon]|nr:MAG: hypothetical protein EON63_15495 [archaeon]